MLSLLMYSGSVVGVYLDQWPWSLIKCMPQKGFSVSELTFARLDLQSAWIIMLNRSVSGQIAMRRFSLWWECWLIPSWVLPLVCYFTSIFVFYELHMETFPFTDGMKEVKVFVDMALNYVGDDPKEMDKVRHLRAVITGYAPLIFKTGSETFLDRCREVAKNIKADRELPAKLVSQSDCPSQFCLVPVYHQKQDNFVLCLSSTKNFFCISSRSHLTWKWRVLVEICHGFWDMGACLCDWLSVLCQSALYMSICLCLQVCLILLCFWPILLTSLGKPPFSER